MLNQLSEAKVAREADEGSVGARRHQAEVEEMRKKEGVFGCVNDLHVNASVFKVILNPFDVEVE